MTGNTITVYTKKTANKNNLCRRLINSKYFFIRCMYVLAKDNIRNLCQKFNKNSQRWSGETQNK